MMGRRRPLLHLITLLLFISCLLSLGNPALRNHVAKAIDVPNQELNKKMPEEEEIFVEGRMDFESLDYTGSGANTRHDPRSPGKP